MPRFSIVIPTPCAESIDKNAPKRGVSGIYQIRNTLSGKLYIGSSADIRLRWQQHFAVLRAGSSHCKYLQSAWIKYGESAFVFEIIELVGVGQVLDREQFHIDTLKPAYNMCPIAGNRSGVPWKEETKAKLRGLVKSPETIEKLRVGVKRSYELNPELRQLRIDTFKAHREANPDYQRGSNNWMFGRKGHNKEQLASPEVCAKRVASIRLTYKEGRAKQRFKPVEQLANNGDVLQRYPSIVAAAKAFNVSRLSISAAVNGRYKTCCGFRWRAAA